MTEGISYKAWLYMCEQEEIEREEAERDKQYGGDWPTWPPDVEDDNIEERSFGEDFGHGSRQIFPGEDPDSICMCPACSAMRAKFEHDVALARAVLHCPEPIPEEVELADAALKSPIARWIQGQLAMERWAS